MPDDLFEFPRFPLDESENRNSVEMHGCIVCARIHTLLVVYAPDDRLVDCAITSPGGYRVVDADHPLVACDDHTPEEIEAAYKRWQSRNEEELREEEEEE